ncbi:MAG: DnaB-like helicase N-terminal domain-containing protein [Terriglobia bacterium]|nr:DnaB-like helicase N-terminal domain-containing protein [Terriglobia bacterium]
MPSDAITPANVDAERSILGGILLDNCLQDEAKAVLSPEDFYLDSNRRIYAAMAGLADGGKPLELISLAEELGRRKELESVGGVAYLTSLTDGVPRRQSIEHHIRLVKEKAVLRSAIKGAQHLIASIGDGGNLAVAEGWATAILDRIRSGNKVSLYRKFDDIPDVFDVDVKPLEWLVSGWLPRKSLTLWAGADGTAKTYLAKYLALKVALGGEWLSRECSKCPVLFLDYENPDHEVKRRQDNMAGGPVPGLKTWGTWLDQQPPAIGDPLLLRLAEEKQPLLIIDPFRYAHIGEENDSTEMMAVMRHLRSYVTAGSTVIVLHHPAKAEGSTGRGSTAIRGAVDIAFLQSMDADGLITLECVKNRFGDKPRVTIRPDFINGTFAVTDAPAAIERRDDVAAILGTITDTPGMSQSAIVEKLHIGRTRGFQLLKQNDGKLWRSERSIRGSICYFPIGTGTRSTSGTEQYPVPAVPVPGVPASLEAVLGTGGEIQQ